MSEGISLGWNCFSASYGTTHNLRTRKIDGYKTCPFDEMITNFQGIRNCINDDFKYLCDPDYLELKKVPDTTSYLHTDGIADTVIHHKKYKFIFNHESPGHANLYKDQNWKEGINHYVNNNYKNLQERYNRRIKNIQDLLNSGLHINFLVTIPNSKQSEFNMEDIIKIKYPNLKFSFIFIDFDSKIYDDHMNILETI